MEAQMVCFKAWVSEVEPKQLKECLEPLLVSSGFGVCGFVEKYFEPYGYTGVWVLSESHLAVHTFPEQKKTYIELSSCVLLPFKQFIEQLPNSLSILEVLA